MSKTKTVIHFVMAFMVVAGLISCKVEPETGDVDISKTSETATLKDTAAPSSVQEFETFAVGGGEGDLLLTWKDPEDKDLYAIKVYYPVDYNGVRYTSTGREYPISSRTVSLDDGFLLNKGTQSYKFTGLPYQPESNGYVLKISAVDESLNESKVEQKRIRFIKEENAQEITEPSDLMVTSVSAECVDGTMKISWKNPSEDNFWGVQICADRNEGAFKTPIYVKGAESYECKNLVDGETYKFYITCLDRALHEGRWPVVSEPVKFIEKLKSDAVPPGRVTSVQITAGDKKVVLSWTNPSDSDFYGTRIIVLAPWQSEEELSNQIVVEGKPSETSSAVFEGLENGTYYRFRLYALDKNQNVSNYRSVSATPTDSSDKVSPAEVTEFNVTASDGNALLTWKNPADDDFWGVEITSEPADGLLKNPVYLQNSEKFECFNLKNGETYKFTIKTMDFNLNKSSGILSDEIVFNSKYSPEFTSFIIPKAGTKRSAYSSNKVTATVKGKYFTYLDVQKESFELSCLEDPSVIANAELEIKSDSMIAISFDIPSSAGIYELNIKYAGRSVSGNFVVKDYSDYSDKIGYIILADGTFVNPDEYESIDEKNPPVAIFAGFNYNGAAIGVGFRCSSSFSTDNLKWAEKDNDGKSYGYRLPCDDIACEVNGENSSFLSFDAKCIEKINENRDTVSFSGDTDGSNNWDIICAFDPQGTFDAEKKYPAFAWANLYGSKYKDCLGAATDGWYLPSVQELFLVHSLIDDSFDSYHNRPTLKALVILDSLDKDRKYLPEFSSDSGTNVFYNCSGNKAFWSSSNVVYRNDYSLSRAWVVGGGAANGYIKEEYKTTSSVRPPLVLVVKTF